MDIIVGSSCSTSDATIKSLLDLFFIADERAGGRNANRGSLSSGSPPRIIA
jgi:hypothetical protein